MSESEGESVESASVDGQKVKVKVRATLTLVQGVFRAPRVAALISHSTAECMFFLFYLHKTS